MITQLLGIRKTRGYVSTAAGNYPVEISQCGGDEEQEAEEKQVPPTMSELLEPTVSAASYPRLLANISFCLRLFALNFVTCFWKSHN